jgi:hypothetical protein
MECICCERELDEREQEFSNIVEIGEHEGEVICEACYYDDQSSPDVNVILCEGDERHKYGVCSYSITDYEDSLDWRGPVGKYIESLGWHSTDPWRGYYAGGAPEGWVRVINDWFGIDGHNVRGDLGLFHERWEEEQNNPPFDTIVAFPRGSNVCACYIEVYIPEGREEEWRQWLDGDIDGEAYESEVW